MPKARVIVSVYMTPEEYEVVEKAARSLNVPISTFIRRVLMEALKGIAPPQSQPSVMEVLKGNAPSQQQPPRAEATQERREAQAVASEAKATKKQLNYIKSLLKEAANKLAQPVERVAEMVAQELGITSEEVMNPSDKDTASAIITTLNSLLSGEAKPQVESNSELEGKSVEELHKILKAKVNALAERVGNLASAYYSVASEAGLEVDDILYATSKEALVKAIQAADIILSSMSKQG